MKPMKVLISAKSLYEIESRTFVRTGHLVMGFVLGRCLKNRQIHIGLREAKLAATLCHLSFVEILCQGIDHEMVHALAAPGLSWFPKKEERLAEEFRLAGVWARK